MKRCLKCGTTNDLTRDHVVPRAVLKCILTRDQYDEFTSNTSRIALNFQVLCTTCNQDKGTDIIDYRETFITAILREHLLIQHGVNIEIPNANGEVPMPAIVIPVHNDVLRPARK